MPRSYVSGCSTGLTDNTLRRVSWKENTKVYLSQSLNVFVPFTKCIFPNFKNISFNYKIIFSECSTGLSDYTVRRVSWERRTPEAVFCPKIPLLWQKALVYLTFYCCCCTFDLLVNTGCVFNWPPLKS